MHGHGADAHFARGADDAHGDLAPVGDEDLVESRLAGVDRVRRVDAIVAARGRSRLAGEDSESTGRGRQ